MEFNENVIYEPDCFAIRRMPAHSDHGYYATGKEADGVESSFLTSLNGRWKFAYANNLAEVIEGFYRKDYDSSNWDEIMVPSSIQLFGYDKLQYVPEWKTYCISRCKPSRIKLRPWKKRYKKRNSP